MLLPQISIALPVWNGAKYLDLAIQSVLDQSFADLELIIIDDSSTDESPQIIKFFQAQDSRITVIRNKTNLKLPGSLNVGFKKARGEWFTWTSDDNVMEKDCLELLINAVEKQKIDFIYSDYKVIDENGDFLKINQTGPAENLFMENTIGACFLYNRRVADKIGEYDVQKFMFEDYDYWVRIYKAGIQMTHLSNLSPYKYRLHESQLSVKRRLPKEFVYFRYDLIKDLDDNYKKARAYIGLTKLAFRNNAPEKGISSILHLLSTNPKYTFPVVYSLVMKKLQ